MPLGVGVMRKKKTISIHLNQCSKIQIWQLPASGMCVYNIGADKSSDMEPWKWTFS